METLPAIQAITPRNLLSFGPENPTLGLGRLNVLIGPNGAGKTNLLEILGLLQSTSRDLTEPIREGGGITEWLWKGEKQKQPSPVASLEVLVTSEHGDVPIRYLLAFTRAGFNISITRESISTSRPFGNHPKPYLYFENDGKRIVINVSGTKRVLRHEDIDPRQSVLSQRKDPDQYPEITFLGRLFGRIAFYRDWEFGINAETRGIHAPDQQSDYLEEDASNLGLILNRLKGEPNVKKQLLEYLKLFYAEAEDIHVQIREGLVELRIEERLGFTTPATRLSDGTLRWLSLLAVLLNPAPPPLICIEEPELGLHPDIIPTLGKLLLEASERTQLIVTTHSDALIEQFTEKPECIVVCEKNDGATSMKRLDAMELATWLERYSLGELWRKGEIGGNRW
jgi:predicted ATPase